MDPFAFLDDDPEIPISRFYRLKPVNLGTPLVEAFTCYFERDAAEMSLLPGVLAAREIVPLLARSATYSNGKTNQITSTWANNCSPALNGLSDSTRHWVETLERLTLRHDLRFLTMLSWGNVISWRGLIKRNRSWCAGCFDRAQHSHTTIYSPLLWFLEPITVCVEHGLRLTSQCPHCGNSMPIMDAHSRQGWCSKCHYWLGSEHVEQDKIPYTEWQTQVKITNWLGEMLAIAPGMKEPPQRECIGRAFSETIRVVFDGNAKALARAMGMNHKSIYELRDGTQAPQIGTLLKLCRILDMSPVNLLINNCVIKPTSSAIEAFPTTSISPQRFDRDRFRAVLELACQDDTLPPIPLHVIAEQLNTDQSHLRHHFPDLCDTIVVRYGKYRNTLKVTRTQRLCDRIRIEALSLHRQGQYPSLKQLGKRLNRTIVREQAVYEAWQQVLIELGYIRG